MEKNKRYFPISRTAHMSSCVTASLHDKNTVYAAFDNHKMGDFKPYLLRSDDRGRTWTSIAGDLPPREIVYSLKQDHVDADLLFAGTEFGAYFSRNGGKNWHRLSGLPTIQVRDIAIQRRENDLVLGTFGRGFYILDDYSPLRSTKEKWQDRDAAVLPIKPALRYIPRSRLGGRGGRGSQGAAFFAASNPPFGAVITYYIKHKLTTARERRIEREQRAAKSGAEYNHPTIEELRVEDEEQVPEIMLTIRDDNGDVVRRLSGSRNSGLHRIAWDLRYPSSAPTSLTNSGQGPLALPGSYTVEVAKIVAGKVTVLVKPTPFKVVELGKPTFDAKKRKEVLAFQKKVARLQRAVGSAVRAAGEAGNRIAFARKALENTPAADTKLIGELNRLRSRLNKIVTKLSGDRTKRRRQKPTPPSLSSRIQSIVGNQWNVTSPPTQTQIDNYKYASEEFAAVLRDLRQLVTKDLKAIDIKLDAAGAPWTPGRIPHWSR